MDKMRKLVFVFWILFTVLTVAGALYVIRKGGAVSAGLAGVPMIFSLIFGGVYRMLITRKLRQNTKHNR